MNWFEKIEIKGFRRLVDVEVELRPLNILVGEDGVGKSSFLDVWLLLKAGCECGLSQKINGWGGVKSAITRPMEDEDRSNNDKLMLGLSMGFPGGDPLTYEFALNRQGNSYWISKEKLTQRDGRIFFDFLEPLHVMQSPVIRPTNPEAKLGHLQATDETPLLFRNRLKTLQHYRSLDLSETSLVWQPQATKLTTSPGANGEDLVSCLYSLREYYPVLFEEFQEMLRTLVPHFEQFDFPVVSNNKVTLFWKDRHYKQSFLINQLSAGTLRFIWVMAILMQPDPPGMILIDEPELGLHSKMLRPLAELLQEASRKTQLMVTTQSDRLVRCMNPEDVIVAGREAGITTFTRGTDIDLSRWLVAYSLGITKQPAAELLSTS